MANKANKNNTNAMPKRPPIKKGVLGRIFKILFKEYKLQMTLVAICIVLVSLASTIASIFMNQFILFIGEGLEKGYGAVSGKILTAILLMLSIYAVGWIASFAYTRIMAVVTQSFMNGMRKKMFDKMQSFPLRYFDSNAHGDIMSHYTNDIEAIRELVSSTLPHLFQSGLIVIFLIFNMLYLSVWMALVVACASVAMVLVAKKVGANSAKNFIAMQRSIAATEGFVEEMMNGQKVVKVFCHEEQSVEDFDRERARRPTRRPSPRRTRQPRRIPRKRPKSRRQTPTRALSLTFFSSEIAIPITTVLQASSARLPQRRDLA